MDYVKTIIAVIVVGVIAFLKGKYSSNSGTVDVPDTAPKQNEAGKHEGKSEAKEEEAKKHENAGDNNAADAEKLRQEAEKLKEEAAKEKKKLEEIENRPDKPTPGTIEEVDEEFKKNGY